MLADGTWTWTYDDAGRVVKRSQGASAETWTYEYDHLGRLTGAEQAATDGGAATATVAYTYDALGNRATRTAWDGTSTTTERFAYDGWDTAKPGAVGTENFDAWAEVNGAGIVTARRAFGAGFDDPLAVVSGSTASWYAADLQGSVRLNVDATGAATDTAAYDGFGNVVSGGAGDRYGYTGREWDGVLGMSYNRARVYDPSVGRWLSEDPLGFAAGDPNLYRYVGNSPTTFVDPSGLRVGILPVFRPMLPFTRPQPFRPAHPPAARPAQPPPAGGGRPIAAPGAVAMPQHRPAPVAVNGHAPEMAVYLRPEKEVHFYNGNDGQYGYAHIRVQEYQIYRVQTNSFASLNTFAAQIGIDQQTINAHTEWFNRLTSFDERRILLNNYRNQLTLHAAAQHLAVFNALQQLSAQLNQRGDCNLTDANRAMHEQMFRERTTYAERQQFLESYNVALQRHVVAMGPNPPPGGAGGTNTQPGQGGQPGAPQTATGGGAGQPPTTPPVAAPGNPNPPNRSLDAILNDDALFIRWLSRPHPVGQPLSASDATKVWEKLVRIGRTPRLDTGHPGTTWAGPHINVGGTHIPVVPSFRPPL